MTDRRLKAERSCIACRRKGAQGEFVRYVSGPDGRITVDYRNRLPGRGAYTCLRRRCVEKAVSNGLFARALRAQLPETVPADVLEKVAAAIVVRITGLIGIARKAGDVVSGSSRLQGAFARREISCLVIAADADDKAEKLVRSAQEQQVAWARLLDRETLGRLSGRGSSSCIGLRGKQFASSLALEINSLQQIAGEN